MRSQPTLIRATRLVVILVAAGAAAVMTTVGLAWLEHEVMLAAIGQDGITGIDDTLPMFLLVAADYGLGLVAGILVLVLGWRRYVRPRSST